MRNPSASRAGRWRARTGLRLRRPTACCISALAIGAVEGASAASTARGSAAGDAPTLRRRACDAPCCCVRSVLGGRAADPAPPTGRKRRALRSHAVLRLAPLTTAAGCPATSPRSRSGRCRSWNSGTAGWVSGTSPRPASTSACRSACAWCWQPLHQTSSGRSARCAARSGGRRGIVDSAASGQPAHATARRGHRACRSLWTTHVCSAGTPPRRRSASLRRRRAAVAPSQPSAAVVVTVALDRLAGQRQLHRQVRTSRRVASGGDDDRRLRCRRRRPLAAPLRSSRPWRSPDPPVRATARRRPRRVADAPPWQIAARRRTATSV